MSHTLKILSPNPRRKQAYPVSVYSINDEITPLKRRRKRHHHRNPFNNFYKEQPEFKPIQFRKVLDGFLLMEVTKVETPYEAIFANLKGRQLGHVIQEDLQFFPNLAVLDLADNELQINHLENLRGLVNLNLMCNKIEFIPHFDPFPQLDTLNLSFNNIKVNGIPLLSQLKKLSHLDLSSNNLTNLPEDLSQFKSLRELRLSGNLFSTDSLIHKASQLFAAIASIPHLYKLDLSYNKFRGIHAEDLKDDAFQHLQELDFSYNWVDDINNLMYASRFGSLQVLIVTGNPFAEGKDISSLENLLKSETGGAIVNEQKWYKQSKEKLPYLRPIAIITQDFTKSIKSQIFGVELSKEMGAVALSELNSTQEEDDVFPKEIVGPMGYKDIYTPSNDRGSSRPAARTVFLTEAEGKQSENQEFKSNRMEWFRKLARRMLGREIEYEKVMNIKQAYTQLRHLVKNPKIYHTRKQGPNYTKSTASRNAYNMIARQYQKVEEKESRNDQSSVDNFKPNRIQSI